MSWSKKFNINHSNVKNHLKRKHDQSVVDSYGKYLKEKRLKINNWEIKQGKYIINIKILKKY